MLTEIYLIRHGWADRDPAVPYETPPGPGLAERGRHEARQAANFLSGRGIRRLYVSPFRRTHETAEHIGEQLGLLLRVHELLMEARNDESIEILRARAQDFLQAVEESGIETIGVVSHGTPLLMLRGALRGEQVNIERSRNGQPPLATAGIWRAWRDGATWQVDLAFEPDERMWQTQTIVL
jgi:broad specificity phosphatase PhoE